MQYESALGRRNQRWAAAVFNDKEGDAAFRLHGIFGMPHAHFLRPFIPCARASLAYFAAGGHQPGDVGEWRVYLCSIGRIMLVQYAALFALSRSEASIS